MLSSGSEETVETNPVKNVTAATIKADVVDASETALVLVLFWSPREKGGKTMAAALENIVRGRNGDLRLALIDIDHNMAIAQQMGVHSIPAVYAFYQGRPVDAFAGAMPEAQIKKWCDQILKSVGLGGDDKPGLTMAFEQAAEHLAGGDIDTAQAIYIDILDMEPENAQAFAGLLRCLIEKGETAEAREKLNAASPALAKDNALSAVRASLDLIEQAGQSQGETGALEEALAKNPNDHQARFDLALAYFGAGRKEDAVNQLLDLVRRDRKWNDAAARLQLLKFFDAFGPADPLTVSARKRLSSILFS